MMRPCPDRAAAAELLERIVATPAARPPSTDDAPLVLYGAGKLGRLAAQLFAALGRPVAYVVDRNPPPAGTLDNGLRVLPPEAVPAADRARLPIAVCVVTAAYTPIRDQLATAGWQRIAPVYDVLEADGERCAMHNGWFAGPLAPDDRAGIGRVLAGWHDDASRAAHLQCLAWRVLREEWTFEGAPVTIDNRYFIPELCAALRDDDTLVDGGAWHGEVIDAFVARRGGRLAAAWAIEPDTENLTALRAWHQHLDPALRARIHLHDFALDDTDGDAAFGAGAGMAARLRSTGGTRVRTCRIDALGLVPGVVKLHLEGHELPALRGGIDTLTRHRPLLAITTYHNRDGLWRTPAWLMDTLPDYRILMRMHGWCGTGAVVYGIPTERVAR